MNRKYTVILSSVAIGFAAYFPLAANAQQGPSSAAASVTPLEHSMPPASRQEANAPDDNTGEVRAADNVADMNVVNSKGQEIGSVDAVVRSTSSNDLNAVVSVGGFLGIGEKKVAIPLKDMRIKGDKLLVPLARTEDELKARPAYDESTYKAVKGDQVVEFSAFEPASEQPTEQTATPPGRNNPYMSEPLPGGGTPGEAQSDSQ